MHMLEEVKRGENPILSGKENRYITRLRGKGDEYLTAHFKGLGNGGV